MYREYSREEIIFWGETYWAPTEDGKDIEPLAIVRVGLEDVFRNRADYIESQIRATHATNRRNDVHLRRKFGSAAHDLPGLRRNQMPQRKQEIRVQAENLFGGKREELQEFVTHYLGTGER